MLAKEAFGCGERLLDDGPRSDIRHVPFDFARLHLGKVENVVEQTRQPFALAGR